MLLRRGACNWLGRLRPYARRGAMAPRLPAAPLLLGLLAAGCTVPTASHLARFSFAVDWSSGGAATTLPAPTFAVRKLEAFVWPKDNRTYAYGDTVNYSDPFYPVSYSSEVGVFSSTDGLTGWKYHGIAVGRGKPGSWDGAGIASPGAASAPMAQYSWATVAKTVHRVALTVGLVSLPHRCVVGMQQAASNACTQQHM